MRNKSKSYQMMIRQSWMLILLKVEWVLKKQMRNAQLLWSMEMNLQWNIKKSKLSMIMILKKEDSWWIGFENLKSCLQGQLRLKNCWLSMLAKEQVILLQSQGMEWMIHQRLRKQISESQWVLVLTLLKTQRICSSLMTTSHQS